MKASSHSPLARRPAPAATGLRHRLRPDRVRAVALEVLGAVREEGQLADRALARVQRRERGLWSAERRTAAEAVYGVLRQETLIDALLRAAGHPPAALPPTEADALRLATHLALDGAQEPGFAPPAAQAIARKAAGLRDAVLAAERDPWDRLALAGSLPRWLVALLGERLGEAETAALIDALNRRAPLTARANLLKTTRDALAERLAQEGAPSHACRFSPWGLFLDGHANAFSLPSFRDGLFELQDEGSQLLVQLCGERLGAKVIDACAGAGGKTLALAAVMANRGELWALDVHEDRLEALRLRARRAGAQNFRRQVITPEGPLPKAIEKLRGRADTVLVDAPCSGVGALRRNPDARRRLTEASVREHAERQLAILRRMAPLVRPGGRLVYATCSLLWQENEDVVEAFLPGSGFEPEPPAATLGEVLATKLREAVTAGPAGLEARLGLRLWPQRHGTDGFFGVALRRASA
ncbi:MAG TPA: RsmB/NOP family class I SAM-dependent RNA methyltransferase [Myxococcales bacterium]|nr:RsmB/NOP family class I SAM-dependent RNA methyltransferase [Myxococcales bacterium]